MALEIIKTWVFVLQCFIFGPNATFVIKSVSYCAMKNHIILFFSVLLLTTSAYSQDTLTKKQWRKQQKSFLLPGRPWTIEIPLWVPGFAGSFAYGDVDLEGEDGSDPENPIEPPGGDLGEIISRLFQTDWYLNFFFLTRVAYEKKGFIFQFDALSGAIGASLKFKYNDNEIVQARFSTTELRLFGGYRIVNVDSRKKKFRYELYAYVGARGYIQSLYSKLNGVKRELDIHPYWVDPIIGLQNQFNFKRWFIVVQGDYGGLFIDNKYSYQISTFVYYRTGRLTSFKLGWNHLHLNHKRTFLDKDLSMKVTFSDPSLGLVFHF